MVTQEIENASEPLLEKILKFIHSQHEPLNVYLDRLREQGEYADDVTDQELVSSNNAYQDYLEGKDQGVGLDELELELFGGHS